MKLNSKTVAWGVIALMGLWLLYEILKYTKERMDSPFKYFSWSEFDSPDQEGSGEKYMSRSFVEKLDIIRGKVGFPLVVSSGYRTPSHNSAVGGVSRSSHMVADYDGKSHAVDLVLPSYEMKQAVALEAIKLGITRIGWGKGTLLHLDDDTSKPQQVVWGYGSGYDRPSFSDLNSQLLA